MALVVDRIPARAREVALVGLFAGAYFVLAQLGLSVLAEPDDVALLWPAAGLALAAVVLAPLRLWPALLAAVFGASLAVQLLSRGPEPLGAALAAITAFETLAAATLLLAVTGRARRYVFGSSRGVAGLLIASALGAGVGAAIGAGALSLALDTPYATGVATWWLADGLGMLAVAPVVLAWGDRRTPAFRREEIALLAAVALVSVAVAYPDTLSVPDPLVQAFVPLPLLCWVAVRAQPRISSLATAALVVVFTRATIDGDGPFAAAAEAAGLDKLQVFLVVAALLALLVEAVLATRRQTERKLAHATEELRSVLSAATESAIIALDVDCRVMVFNEGAQRMLGYTPREAAGRTFDVFSLPSEVTRRAAELGIDPGVEVFVRTARRGEAETRRWTVVRRDGGTLPVSLTVTPRIDDDGRLVGFIGVAQDVTESVRFETERAALIRASRAVAEGGPIEATLGLLAREMGELCDAKLAAVTRFESAELGTILGAWSASGRLGTGHPIDLRDDTAAAMVSQRGAACNIPPAAGENEPSPARAGVPVIVDSTLWGAVSVGAGSVELDADVESLLARFADLVALAVANDESRREVERKRDELSAIIDGLPALVWVRDLSGRLLLANRDFSELCGDGADQFSEELLLEALSDPTLDADALTSESATTIEQEFVDPGGDARTLLVSRWPLESDGGVYALACVATDISERRAHERAKDEFIQVVSHELRTPLSSIRGALSLLSEDESDFDDVARRRMVNIASSNSERLASLVNDILDLQRIESGAPVLDRAEWDSGSLVAQAVEDMQALAEERDIQLVSSPAAFPVYAERGRVVQVLNNFLSNAIKFSEPGGRVEVGSLTRDDEAAFYVRDEGAGIPEHLLEAVFERFHQVDSSASRAVGGTGLGLAICRQIAELHDGRTWAESVLGEGSCFWFSVPLTPAASAPEPLTSGGETVIVCDDDPGGRAETRGLVESLGFDVVEADSCGEVLAHARTRAPSAIILSLMVAGPDGQDALARLAGDPATAPVPIVVLSPLGPDRLESLPAPVADWVTAPATIEDMARALSLTRVPPAADWVLVVEDDDDLAEVLLEQLRRDGIPAVHARTGQQAVEMAARLEPALIALDIGLPDGDGFDVVEALRAREIAPGALVVYSALELDPADRERLRLGRTVFLTKSRVTPRDFHERVTSVLPEVTTV